MTWLLTEGLVRRGHEVTLFATGNSTTSARLHATFAHGCAQDVEQWPWEIYEMLNLAAAIERAGDFDLIHYQSNYFPITLPFRRLSRAPLVQSVHHSVRPAEVALWKHYPEVHFIAVSREQARLLDGVTIAGIVYHGVDTGAFSFREAPEDYIAFLGRFTPGKGVLDAIDVARRVGIRLFLAARENDYYREHVARHVDGRQIVYAGELGHDAKVALLGGARALLYPVQAGEPFGLVMAEAMACGTPIAALDRGAVTEVIDAGVTGYAFSTLDQLVAGLPDVFSLDRAKVRQRAIERFSIDRMVGDYVRIYERIIAGDPPTA
jgi:glycosyltransferase involved in cell wall biosynthesis